MSNRDVNEIFERVEQALERHLSPRGYVVTKRQHHPNVFGNRFTVYTGKAGHVRFTWDGKANQFILRKYKKRSKVANALLLSFLGKYDLDKLTAEVIVRHHEAQSLTDEQWIQKITENQF